MVPGIDDEVFGMPVAKRQRVNVVAQEAQKARPAGSRVFSPYRTLGLVSSTNVPFTSIPLGKTTFQITTSVGRCLQTYDLRKGLQLVFLTRPETPELVTATYAYKDRVLAAWGSEGNHGVWVFKRGKKVAELEAPQSQQSAIEELFVFGSWIVGSTKNTIEVWKSATYEHYTTITPAAGAVKSDRILSGKICNMPTYLNKIFVGRMDGGVEIWNVSTGKLVYTVLPPAPKCGAVAALQHAPALSLLAIAYENGILVIHNIRSDQVVLQLKHTSSTKSPITSISFRTDELGAGDDGRKPGVMATAGRDSGDVTLWDLNKGGRITGVLRSAHEAGINKVELLNGQPVMISTGMDNALRTWIFDETPFSPIPRPLHSRSGHAAPVTKLGFLPASSDNSEEIGKWLLSASKDQSLWGFSLRRDNQNTELSQGNVKKKAKKLGRSVGQDLEFLKAPEITCMACSLNRDGGMGAAGAGPVWSNSKVKGVEESNATGWESVVTGHKGDRSARTWFWGRKRAGRWVLPTSDGTQVTSVTVTSCGTFALVGSEGGSIDMFNLQSGVHRQNFPAKLSPAQAKRLRLQQLAEEENPLAEKRVTFSPGEGRHTGAVTGLMVDNINKTAISCGADGKLKFWDFLSGHLLGQLNWNPMTTITGLRYSSTSDLIALSCDDLSIRVVDIETRKVVRELWGCAEGINDYCFSQDGRWIVAASADSVIRIWDLPTGHLIDAFRTHTVCTALSLSATGQFLATAHDNDVGIGIWNNRSLFVHVPTKQIKEDDIADVAGPSASGFGGSLVTDAAFEESEDSETQNMAVTSDEQLSKELMTLSIVPKSRWQTLIHLDTIRQRNKPTEAPKLPEKAPFFLPSQLSKYSTSAQNTLTDTPNQDPTTSEITAYERSRISKLDPSNPQSQKSPFTSLLHTGIQNNDYASFITHLKTLSPSTTDLEIRSLDPRSNERVAFVEALTARLIAKRDFELVNAWMAVFLKCWGDSVVVEEDSEGIEGIDAEGEDRVALLQALAQWKEAQKMEGERLGQLVGYVKGVVGFLRSART